MPTLFLTRSTCLTLTLITAAALAGCAKPTAENNSVASQPATVEQEEKSGDTEATSVTMSDEAVAVPNEPEATSETPALQPVSAVTKVEKSWEKSGITLTAASWDEVQEELKKHKGKVVVLDIWSSWCLPCVRELPHLIELQQQFPKEVVCISLNVNYDGSESTPPSEHAAEVLDLLVKKQARIINLLSTTADETIYETVELASIPVAYVYNADGELHKRFDNETSAYGEEGFTYVEHIQPVVAQLVKELAQAKE